MTNEQVMVWIERFHKPAQNVKIKAAYVILGVGIIGIAYFAIKSSVTKSKEIRQLKDATSKNHESIKNLTSRSAMLEHDLQQNESIIESLNKEKKELVAKIEKANNSAVYSKIEKI
jgi:predicted RNase H-like nuclease (RuvC/YqgF family)